MSTTLLKARQIVTPDRTLDVGAVLVRDGRISQVLSKGEPFPQAERVVEGGALTLIPGLIDLHCHGYAGMSASDPERFGELCLTFARHGVTCWLPTFSSASQEWLRERIPAIAALLPGTNALGLHIEGPYFNKVHAGAQDRSVIRLPDVAEVEEWLALAGGSIRLVALAPELEGAEPVIRLLADRGVRIAAGHTGAGLAEILRAVGLGLTQATHTCNGMLGLHHRDVGCLGAVLADDRIFCELIADGFHVHPDICKVIARAKGRDRLVLVTDAVELGGLPDGEYPGRSGAVRVVKDGQIKLAGGTLAGSSLTMNRAVSNLARFAGVSLADAVRAASANPAAALGLTGRKGCIAPGADADLALVDGEMNVHLTMVGGRTVYTRGNEEG